MSPSNFQIDCSQSALRADAKRARARLTPSEKRKASEKIAERLFDSNHFRGAVNIACYIPLSSEVDTWTIIKRAWELKKRIFAPCVEKTSTLRFCRLKKNSGLRPNKMGVQEPQAGQIIPADELDLVITPLVAFDSERNRIGMGGGYYDRSFSFLQHDQRRLKPILIGVAFNCQQVEKISPNPWDIPLSGVFTESGKH